MTYQDGIANLNQPNFMGMVAPNTKKYALIHTIDVCPWCVKAKKLLDEFNIEYDEVKDFHPDHNTVPYIIIDGEVVGGYGELRDYVADL